MSKKSRNKVYLDASFILAFLVNDHEFQQQAVNIAKKLSTASLYLSFFCLNEVMFVLTKYGLSKKEVRTVLTTSFLSLDNLFIVSSDATLSSTKEYLKTWERTPLKPTDAMHLHIMRQNGIKTIATFDEDFIGQGERLGITITQDSVP